MIRKTVYVALQQFCETDDRPLQVLQEAGFDVRRNSLGRRLRREEISSLVQEADAVVAGVEPYDGAVLSTLPRLRCISRCGVGTDTIDLEAAKSRNVAVLTTPDEVVQPVAEMTVAMILALARNLPQHAREMEQGEWIKHTGRLLSEWTVGFVGFGRIGRAVEKLLRPFGCRLAAHDPALDASSAPPGLTLMNLSELLSRSDVVSLHASRRPEQGALLGRDQLFGMKKGSRLVNTARGTLVDEAALIEALRSGHLAAAALDVYEKEPYSGPLAELPQVLLTPHVSSLTRASRAAMELRCAKNVVEFFR